MATFPKGLEATFARAVSDLSELGARYAVIGGIAFGIRVAPRTTTDIDFAVSVEDEAEGDTLIFALQQRGYRIDSVLQRKDGRLATVRTTLPPWGDIYVDFLFHAAGIENEAVRGATSTAVFSGARAPVVQTWHLLAMKVKAARAKDVSDMEAIVLQADAASLAKAEGALRLVQKRTGESRDLVGELREFVARVRNRRSDFLPASKTHVARLRKRQK